MTNLALTLYPPMITNGLTYLNQSVALLPICLSKWGHWHHWRIKRWCCLIISSIFILLIIFFPLTSYSFIHHANLFMISWQLVANTSDDSVGRRLRRAAESEESSDNIYPDIEITDDQVRFFDQILSEVPLGM